MQSVFDYLDYRELLKDFYEKRKQEGSYFSYRLFSSRVGIDASYLAKVIIKTRHISNKSIPAFIKFCGLKGKEADYFENLVYFGKAKSDKQSRVYFEKLLTLKSVPSTTLTEDQYEFYQKWHHTAIRSILEFYDFRGDYKALGEKLSPPISSKEARESVKLLGRLGLIKKTREGRFILTDKAITTGPEWRSLAIQAFQEKVIRLAGESLARHHKNLRDISTITMNINRENFEEIRERIKAFRESIIQYVNECSDADRVYHLNLQLVPLTNIKGKKK